MSKHRIEVFYSEEDGGYIANVPDLEFCSAFGRTREEALAEVKIAMAAWLEARESLSKAHQRHPMRG